MGRFAPHPIRRPVLVAGASSGIGAATAVELAARGYPVALGARRVEKCQELADQIRAMGGEALAVELDVTDDHSVAYCLAMTVEVLGDIDVLVAGAGDTTFGLLADIDSASFDDQLQVHLVGANRLATAVLPGMARRQRGQLIFVGSDVALRRRPHMGAYGAAKVALTSMVESLQMELEGSGVSASIVHPGPTRTAMGSDMPQDALESIIRDWALWGHARHNYTLRAGDVARAIAFVADTPPGGYIASMVIEPQAPLAEPRKRPHQQRPQVSGSSPSKTH